MMGVIPLRDPFLLLSATSETKLLDKSFRSSNMSCRESGLMHERQSVLILTSVNGLTAFM